MASTPITRWILAMAAPLGAVAVYVGLYHTVPGFAANTRRLFGLVAEPADSKIIRTGRRTFLWGGDDPDSAFDVTESDLVLEQLDHGLGREHFPALIEPRFVPARDVAFVPDGGRVIAVEDGGTVKLYPLSILKSHEVVNDTINGMPVFVAYCVLADLGAVYDRRVGDTTLTFAVSGFTYHDDAVWDGDHAFLLWDRDTESLWWPPIAIAVSGPLRGAPLRLYDERLWSQTTWRIALAAHPDAVVLDRFQREEPPLAWPRRSRADFGDIAPSTVPLAPRWGQNATLESATSRPVDPSG